MSCCSYIEIQCDYGCSQGRLLRGDMEQHREICEKRPVSCEHCIQRMPYIELTVSLCINDYINYINHICITCLQFKVLQAVGGFVTCYTEQPKLSSCPDSDS